MAARDAGVHDLGVPLALGRLQRRVDPVHGEGRDGLSSVPGGLATLDPLSDLGGLVACLLRSVAVDGVPAGTAGLVGDAEVDLPPTVGAATWSRPLAVTSPSARRPCLWRPRAHRRLLPRQSPNDECRGAEGRASREVHRSLGMRRGVDDVEQPALVCGSSAASAPAPSRRWGSLEAIDVALELGTGQATAPTDVHRPQFSGLDEPVDRRASDPQHLSGFLRRQQQRIAGQSVLERLRMSHVGNRGGGGSGKPPVRLRGTSTVRGRRPTGTSSSAARYWGTTGDRSSVHGWSAGHVGAPSVGLQHGLQCPGEAGEVAVVDATVVHLARELAEQRRPVPPGGFEGDADLDPSLYHLHGGPARARSSRLLPGSMPAGGRAPLGDRAPASRRDRPAAPATGRGGRPSLRAVRSGALRFGADRRRGSLGPLTPLLLPLPPSCTVFGAAAGSHADDCADEAPVTRHHELGDPR